MILAKEYRYDQDILIRPKINNFQRGHGEKFNIIYENSSFEIGIWEYDKMYQYKGLYDFIYCDIVKEVAPFEAVYLLVDTLKKENIKIPNLSILDLGAGSGIAGEQIKKYLPEANIVGCDIAKNAKDEAIRLRPNVYSSYYTEDITSPQGSKILIENDFNVYFILSASGGGDDESYKDVMTDSYLKLINHAKSGDVFALNTRKKFTKGQEEIMALLNENCETLLEKTSFYRFLINGEAVYTKYYILRK